MNYLVAGCRITHPATLLKPKRMNEDLHFQASLPVVRYKSEKDIQNGKLVLKFTLELFEFYDENEGEPIGMMNSLSTWTIHDCLQALIFERKISKEQAIRIMSLAKRNKIEAVVSRDGSILSGGHLVWE